MACAASRRNVATEFSGRRLRFVGYAGLGCNGWTSRSLCRLLCACPHPSFADGTFEYALERPDMVAFVEWPRHSTDWPGGRRCRRVDRYVRAREEDGVVDI